MNIQRICIISENDSSIMEDEVVFQLTQGMLKQGVKVQTITSKEIQYNSLDKNVKINTSLNKPFLESPIHSVRRNVITCCSINKHTSHFQPQLMLITITGPLAIIAINSAKKLDIPIVYLLPSELSTLLKYKYPSFMKKTIQMYLGFFYRCANLILTLNNHQDFLNIQKRSNREFLARGVDSQLYNPIKRDNHLRKEWGLDPNDQAVIFISKASASSVIHLAIKTYLKMKRYDPCLKFVLVGKGRDLDEIRATHRDFIYYNTHLNTDLARYYASSDILLSPNPEVFEENSILEAMASGLAVISFRHSEASKLIEDNISGLLVDTTNSNNANENAFIKKASSLMRNPEKIKGLQHEARRIAETASWGLMRKQFKALVSPLISSE